MLTRVPGSAHPAAAPTIAAMTIVTVVALMLRAPRRLRPWTPILGIGLGCLTAAFFGVLDFGRVAGAPWLGVPAIATPGLDGIAARRVGVYIGAIFIALAFVPKITALVLSIPAPVLGAYIVVIFGLAFAQGMRVVFREGPERRNSLIAGLSFWIGAGIQFQAIFPSHLATPTGRMLANGLTAGGLSILLLNLFIQFTGPRRHRAEMRLSTDRQPQLDRFMVDFATGYGWHTRAIERLRAAAEEVLLSLLRQEEDEHAPAAKGRRLRVVARNLREGALLEFTAATHAGNLENEMVVLADSPDPGNERDLSLALLRHHASSVKHHQHHNVDILTCVWTGSDRLLDRFVGESGTASVQGGSRPPRAPAPSL